MPWKRSWPARGTFESHMRDGFECPADKATAKRRFAVKGKARSVGEKRKVEALPDTDPYAPLMDEPLIYLITGPMAAGKSTVAHLLASRFDRGVHLEGDVFRRSIV